MSRSVQVVILCEDRQHAAFARRFLARAAKHLRVQRVEISPKGRGAGEQFVRERFPKELAYYRSRQHRVEQGMIVMIDADGEETADRIAQVESQARRFGKRHGFEIEGVMQFGEAWHAGMIAEDILLAAQQWRAGQEAGYGADSISAAQAACPELFDVSHGVSRHRTLLQPGNRCQRATNTGHHPLFRNSRILPMRQSC